MRSLMALIGLGLLPACTGGVADDPADRSAVPPMAFDCGTLHPQLFTLCIPPNSPEIYEYLDEPVALSSDGKLFSGVLHPTCKLKQPMGDLGNDVIVSYSSFCATEEESADRLHAEFYFRSAGERNCGLKGSAFGARPQWKATIRLPDERSEYLIDVQAGLLRTPLAIGDSVRCTLTVQGATGDLPRSPWTSVSHTFLKGGATAEVELDCLHHEEGGGFGGLACIGFSSKPEWGFLPHLSDEALLLTIEATRCKGLCPR